MNIERTIENVYALLYVLFTLLNIFSDLNLFYIKSYLNLICNIFEYVDVYRIFCLLYKNVYIEYFLYNFFCIIGYILFFECRKVYISYFCTN